MNVLLTISLFIGWGLDIVFGDPARLPHPVVGFGKVIAACERRWNGGTHRRLKGGLVAVGLIAAVFLAAYCINLVIYSFHPSSSTSHSSPSILHASLFLVWNAAVVFFCLAGTTLIREVRAVFLALDRSLDDGRRQVARIVGRDTSQLSAQEVRTAALETLAENLSDGVVAPLFWFALLGAPGMLAYKMVNTLDSMIGYRTERYRDFGCVAAHIDDIANYLPARLTALLMIGGGAWEDKRTERGTSLFSFVLHYGPRHASPNSGYPEAALAGILNCRFGGPHIYFGELIDKPFIGHNDRPLTTEDMCRAIRVNRMVEVLMVAFTAAALFLHPLNPLLL